MTNAIKGLMRVGTLFLLGLFALPADADEDRTVADIVETAGALRRDGNLDGAERVLTEALDAMGADAEQVEAAALWLELGRVLASLGEYDRAIAALERPVSGDTSSALTRRALAVLASTCIDAGHVAKGLRTAERLLDVTREHGDAAELASALQHVAIAFGAAGDKERDEALLREAIVIAETAGDRVQLRAARTSLAVLLTNRGAIEEAREAATALLELTDDDPYRLAKVDHLLGFLASQEAVRHERAGDKAARDEADARAIPHLERARAGYEADGDRSQLVHLLKLISDHHLRRGDIDAALETGRAALAVAEALRRPRGLVLAHAHLGLVHGARQDYARAIVHLRAAVEQGLEIYRGLGETIALGNREFMESVFLLAGNAVQLTGDVEAATFFVEARRAQSLLEMLATRDAVGAVPVTPALRREEARARAAVAEAARAYEDSSRLAAFAERRRARKALDVAHVALEQVVDRVRREAKAAAALVYPTPASRTELREMLAPDEALVIYELQSHVLRAIVVTSEKVRLATLGPTMWFTPLVNRLLKDEQPYIDQVAAKVLAARALSSIRLPASIRRLYVSPVDRLAYVPFTLLAPDKEIVYVPSGTALRMLRDESHPRGEGVLGLGDPTYRDADPDASATDRSFSSRRLLPLPATRDEVLAVADVHLLGDAATEAGLRKALSERTRWRAVHFACHGLLDTKHPMLSALALTPDAENDGFLDVKDVLRLRVPADLVVLSACDTARGELGVVEGVIGLTRAFLASGADTVLCSLWKVDDAATRALMEHFYERWNLEDGEGLTAAAALKLAQAHIRAQPGWEHPYYWAAWVLWGQGD